MLVVLPYYTPNAVSDFFTSSAVALSSTDTSASFKGRLMIDGALRSGARASSPTAPVRLTVMLPFACMRVFAPPS